MPASGRPWRRTLAQFKAECERRGDVCHICRARIDYTLRGSIPPAFAADHLTPTSEGGDVLRVSNLAPSHFGCNSSRGNTTRGLYPSRISW